MKYVKGTKLTDMCSNPIEQMSSIWANRMSSSYVKEDLLERCLNGEGALYAAVEDGEILGYAAGDYIKVKEMKGEFEKEEVHPDYIESSGKASILYIIAVREDSEGRGIGTNVAEKTVNELVSYSTITLGEAWIRPGRKDGSDVLESLGFNKLYESDEYWKPRTKGNSTPCPECGNATCTCSGALYVK
jgi:GNAT superfamily N-acetyltransferase